MNTKRIIAMTDCLQAGYSITSHRYIYSFCTKDTSELGFFPACSPGLVYLGPWAELQAEK